MIYESGEHLNGIGSAIVGAVISIGKSVMGYQQAKDAKSEADLADLTAQTDIVVAQRQAGERAKRDAENAALDNEKSKRYLIYGAAVGIPLLLGIMIAKKG